MQFFLNLDAAEAANQKVEQTGADSMAPVQEPDQGLSQ